MFPELAGGKAISVLFLTCWGAYQLLAVNGAVRKREPVCTRNSCGLLTPTGLLMMNTQNSASPNTVFHRKVKLNSLYLCNK